MKYLRAKYDFELYGTKDEGGVKVFYPLGFFPRGSLTTLKEWERARKGYKSFYLEGNEDSLYKQTSDETFFLEEVSISRKKTYFFFGARKAMQAI